MSDCIFCKIASGEVPSTKVYEDDLVIAIMDIQPVNAGHVLVLPKKHFAHLHEMDEETGAHLFRVAMRVERAIRASELLCEGTNLLQNNGRPAMQEVFHVHLHIMPRYRGDQVKFRFPQEKTPPEELEQAAGMIREQLN